MQDIQTDSRKITPGATFVLLDSVLGLSDSQAAAYAYDALDRGARQVVCERPWTVVDGGKVIHKADIRLELGRLIASKAPADVPYVIAVTGTNGKTTISQLIAQLSLDPCAVLGTAGAGLWGQLEPSHHTTPDTVFVHAFLRNMHTQGAVLCALEASSHGLSQERLSGVPIRIGIFSNLSRDHLDYHADMGAYLDAKMRLFDRDRFGDLQTAVLNLDDGAYTKIVACMEGVDVLTYSLTQDSADFFAKATPTPSGMRLILKSPLGMHTLESPLIGRFNASNLLAALGALYAYVKGNKDAFISILDKVNRLESARGRMEVVGRLPLCLVDYAHTPDALTQAIQAARVHTQGKLWLVCGCGGNRDKGKRALMGLATDAADETILTADNPRDEDIDAILDDMQMDAPHSMRIRHRAHAILHALMHADVQDTILIAGKGHEDYQEIRGIRYPFCDRKMAQYALSKRAHLSWGVSELSTALGCAPTQNASDLVPCMGVVTKSQDAQAMTVFVALKGMRFDAHEFVQDAYHRGTRVFVVSQAVDLPLDACIYQVSDTRLALGQLGRYHLERVRALGKVEVVALTGSSGKTTTKNLLAGVLSMCAKTQATRGNLNNDLGVPMTLLELAQDTRYLVLELGANHLGEIAYTVSLCVPDVVAVLNVGSAHVGEFGGIDKIARAKCEIITQAPPSAQVVLPLDCAHYPLFAKCAKGRNIITFGAGADVSASRMQLGRRGAHFNLSIGAGNADVRLGLLGRHNVDNAQAAAAVAHTLGMSIETIAKGLGQAHAPDGRLHRHSVGEVVLIDDTYNANFEAMCAAAAVLEGEMGVRVLVLGEMGELGCAAADMHYTLGKRLASYDIDYIIATGDLCMHLIRGALYEGADAVHLPKDALAGYLFERFGQQKSAFLFKGSRSAKMEEVLQGFLTLIDN